MAKKKKELVQPKSTTPRKLYKIIPPGVCPYCGKGPVSVIVRDQYPMVIDKDGYAMILGETTTNTIGVCVACGHTLGPYEQRLFKWFPENHPYKNQSLEETRTVKPSYNFFGNKEEQLGGRQEWIINS